MLLKIYNLLFCLLALVVTFFIGLFLTGLVGVGKNDGFAGAATILMYGFGFAVVGFISSIILIRKLNKEKIIFLNKILTLILIVFIGIVVYRYYSIVKPQHTDSGIMQPKKELPTN